MKLLINLSHTITVLEQEGGLSGDKEPGLIDLIADKPFTDYFGEEQYPGLFMKQQFICVDLQLLNILMNLEELAAWIEFRSIPSK